MVKQPVYLLPCNCAPFPMWWNSGLRPRRSVTLRGAVGERLAVETVGRERGPEAQSRCRRGPCSACEVNCGPAIRQYHWPKSQLSPNPTDPIRHGRLRLWQPKKNPLQSALALRQRGYTRASVFRSPSHRQPNPNSVSRRFESSTSAQSVPHQPYRVSFTLVIYP